MTGKTVQTNVGSSLPIRDISSLPQLSSDVEMNALLWETTTLEHVISQREAEQARPSDAVEWDEDWKVALKRQGKWGKTPAERWHRETFRRADDLVWPTPRKDQSARSFHNEVHRYLTGMALRLMREGQITPDHGGTREDLADALWCRAEADAGRGMQPDHDGTMRTRTSRGTVWEACDDIVFNSNSGELQHITSRRVPATTGVVTISQVSRMVETATRTAWRDYEPGWLARRREAAAEGGRTSRRGPTWTLADLEGIADLKPAEIAARLGCSRSKAYELVKEWKATQAVEPVAEEVLEDPLDAKSGDSATTARPFSKEVSVHIDALLDQVMAPSFPYSGRSFAYSGHPITSLRDPASARYPTDI